MINRIIVDPVWRTESQSAICAARKHDVCAGREASRLHRGNHVNVVVGGPAGTVHCQKALPLEATRIDRVAEVEVPAKVNLCYLVKSRGNVWVLRITGANAVKWTAKVSGATNEEIAVCVDVECSPDRRVRQTKWTLPGNTAVCGTTELPKATGGGGAPSLVLKAMAHAIGFIDCKPLLVAASAAAFARQPRPGLAAVSGAPDIVAEGLKQAQIKKGACFVGLQYGVAAKDIVLQNTGEGPGHTGIRRISPTALAEVGVNRVELPPTDCHFVAIGRVDCNRRLVGRVAEDVLVIRVHVHLKADEGPVRGDHARRRLKPVNVGRRHVIFFQRLAAKRLACRSLP